MSVYNHRHNSRSSSADLSTGVSQILIISVVVVLVVVGVLVVEGV